MLARRFATGVLLLVLGTTGIATADTGDENVTVDFRLSTRVYLAQFDSEPFDGPPCQLSVALGANGIDVLDAAVAQRCIISYSLKDPETSHARVECIDGVCNHDYEAHVPPCIPCGNPLVAYSVWYTSALTTFAAESGSVWEAEYRTRGCVLTCRLL